MPFLITESDVEQYNLESCDIGKWGMFIKGAISVFNSEEAAQELWMMLLHQMPTHSRTKAAWIYSGGFSVFNEWEITQLSNPFGQKFNLIFTKSGQKIDFCWAKTSQTLGQKINI